MAIKEVQKEVKEVVSSSDLMSTKTRSGVTGKMPQKVTSSIITAHIKRKLRTRVFLLRKQRNERNMSNL